MNNKVFIKNGSLQLTSCYSSENPKYIFKIEKIYNDKSRKIIAKMQYGDNGNVELDPHLALLSCDWDDLKYLIEKAVDFKWRGIW